MNRLLLIFCLVAGAFEVRATTTNWCAPFVTGTGSGLDPNNCRELAEALNNHHGPDTDFELTDGLYNAGKQLTFSPLGVYQFHDTTITAAHPMRIHAVHPHMAIIAFGTNGGIAAASSIGFVTPGAIFDGLQICSNTIDGLGMANFGVVTNCWVHDNTQQGINSSSPHAHDNLFDSNLLERNGSDTVSNPGHYHNIYVYGANNIFRNNVSRYAISGRNIQFYTAYPSDTPGTNNYIYNNLAYGSTGFAQANDQWNGILHEDTLVFDQEGDNYVFNNTFDSWVIEGGTPHWTNNIIFDDVGRQPIQIGGYGHINLKCDYNLGTNAFPAGFAGTHDTTTTWAGIGFVNAPNGLYWLSAGSVARGKSLSGVAGPVDFFSNPESSHIDSGFVVFKTPLANDIRVLDPDNGITFPNYWQALNAVSRIMQATALHVGLTKFGP